MRLSTRPNLLLLVATICLLFSCKPTIPDGQLRSTISDRLLATPGMTFVTVSVEKGIAKLTGTVSSDRDKSLAGNLSKIEGINGIDNQITVVPPTPEPTPEPEIASDEPPTLDDEAQKIAEEFWNKTLTKCGDTYYFKVQSLPYLEDYTAFKSEPSIYVDGTTHQPKELTPAEKLNKVDPFPVEWSGYVKLSYSLKRTRRSEKIYGGSDGRWSEWSDGEATNKIELSKVKGKWHLNNPDVDRRQNVAAVKCSDADGTSR